MIPKVNCHAFSLVVLAFLRTDRPNPYQPSHCVYDGGPTARYLIKKPGIPCTPCGEHSPGLYYAGNFALGHVFPASGLIRGLD